MNNLPCVQITVKMPDEPCFACKTFDELKERICTDSQIIEKYAKAKQELLIEEEFEDFLNYWFKNGMSGRANFYTAKMKVEPIGTIHTGDKDDDMR